MVENLSCIREIVEVCHQVQIVKGTILSEAPNNKMRELLSQIEEFLGIALREMLG